MIFTDILRGLEGPHGLGATRETERGGKVLGCGGDFGQPRCSEQRPEHPLHAHPRRPDLVLVALLDHDDVAERSGRPRRRLDGEEHPGVGRVERASMGTVVTEHEHLADLKPQIGHNIGFQAPTSTVSAQPLGIV